MSNPVGAQRYGLGGGDAYYDAVKYGGYTGTREQFGRDQAEFAENATAVAEAREEVEHNTQTVVNTAQTFTEETVPAAIQSVEEKGDTEEDRLELRTTELVEAVNTAGALQVQAVRDEGTTQTGLVSGAGTAQVEAVEQAGSDQVDAVEAAGSTQVGNVNNAGTTQVGNVNSAGTTQVGNVNTAGATQVQAVEDKGEEIINSIPADYTELSNEVGQLKNDMSNQYHTLGTNYQLALGTWENGAFTSWNKRIANRYLIDVKKGDIITVLSETLRWNLGIYREGSQTISQNTGWNEPSENSNTVIANLDGKLFLIFAKTSGDTMSLSDYDSVVNIYNTFSGHVFSQTTGAENSAKNVDGKLQDVVDYQKYVLFDESISFTTFKDIPVNFPAGTYTYSASNFVSSDTDVSVCRVVLRSNNSDVYVFDNSRIQNNSRVIILNTNIDVLRIYAGTTYNNSLNDTLSVDSMIFYQHTGLSKRLDEIESNQQTEKDKTKPLTERTTGILNRIKGKYISHIGVSKSNNIIIPSQSLADLERTVRLGFNSIELNVRKTSDDKYVCIHGESGNFGSQFEDINGNSVRNIAVSSMTLADIKNIIRFKSKYARYKTAPLTLQEMLYECKKLGIIPLIEYQTSYTDEVSIIESIMGKSDYMLITYQYDRSVVGSNAPMFSWLTYTNANSLVAKCDASGGAYIAGLNITADEYSAFTENDWKALVSAVHEAGYAISCAYGSESLKQMVLKCGFDFINTSNNVNEIETGNALNITDTVSFDGFNTNGSISDGILSLSNGQTIAPTTIPNSVFLGVGSLHIVFNGEITVTMGGVSFGTFQSDGSQETWLSTLYEEAVPTFEITSVGSTSVRMLSFKSSEV